jgi:hypothetical protein
VQSKDTTVPLAVCTDTLVPRQYGLHGRDIMLTANSIANFVYVDPGHATLLHAVRQHATTVRKAIIPSGPHNKQRRALGRRPQCHGRKEPDRACSYESAMAT